MYNDNGQIYEKKQLYNPYYYELKPEELINKNKSSKQIKKSKGRVKLFEVFSKDTLEAFTSEKKMLHDLDLDVRNLSIKMNNNNSYNNNSVNYNKKNNLDNSNYIKNQSYVDSRNNNINLSNNSNSNIYVNINNISDNNNIEGK